jgi:hypothetical protein
MTIEIFHKGLYRVMNAGVSCTSECNLVESKEIEISEGENAKFACENNVDKIFNAKGIIHHKFVPEKQTVNDKFYQEVIKTLIAQVHRVRPEFQEIGSRCLLHDNAPAYSSGTVSEFLAKRGIPVLSPPSYSLNLVPADFLYFLNKELR